MNLATAHTRAPDLSERDSMADICVLAPTRRRKSVDRELQAAYWLDCHGPAVAAFPGLSVYYQQHLDPDRGDLWPRLPGISNALAEDEQLDGFAELGWANEDDAAAFSAAAEEANLMEDEQNLFDTCILQAAAKARTFYDCLIDPAPNGDSPCLRLMIGFRRADGAGREEFGERIFDRLAPALAAEQQVLKLRAFLLDDYLPEHWNSPNVNHDVPTSQQYQAVIELAVANRLDLNLLFATKGFAVAVAGLGDTVSHVNAFPVRGTYGYVFQGQRTLVGELGSHRARVVTAIGSARFGSPAPGM